MNNQELNKMVSIAGQIEDLLKKQEALKRGLGNREYPTETYWGGFSYDRCYITPSISEVEAKIIAIDKEVEEKHALMKDLVLK